MYIEGWVLFLLALWILSLLTYIQKLKKQIATVYGSLLVAQWTTGFVDRLEYVLEGLDSHQGEFIETQDDGSIQLSNALFVIDNEELRKSINTLRTFLEQEKSEELGIHVIKLPPREWYEEVGDGDKENAYLIVRKSYGDMYMSRVKKINPHLRSL